MFKVYLLQNLVNNNKSYIGRTIKPINVRVNKHNLGLSKSTKPYKPWKLIYYENFYCELCTDKREQYLKSGVGYRFRKMILKNQSEL